MTPGGPFAKVRILILREYSVAFPTQLRWVDYTNEHIYFLYQLMTHLMESMNL